ncbi:MAG: formyltransferase family protein [Acidobacteriota bacterium]
MRITILAHRDLHANRAVNLLRPALAEHQVTLCLSESVGKPRAGYVPPDGLQQLKFLEQEVFNTVLSPLAERQDSTEERHLTFRELGAAFGTPTEVLASTNTRSGLERLVASRPDLVVSIRYGCILRQRAIAVPRLGVLNLHSGLLPRYQGILTTLHSLVEGRAEVGCTLHRIDSSMIDTGPIVATARIPVDPTHSLFWHIAQLYPAGCRLIADAIERLARDQPLDAVPQDPDGAAYYGLPEPEHFDALAARGIAVWHPDDLGPLYRRYLNESEVG